MLQFEPRDPFPHLSSQSLSKSAKYLHSALVDQWLGLRVDKLEAKLSRHGSRAPAPNASGTFQNLWFGLEPQDLLTPYVEIREVLELLSLRDGETVVDLGAAYGRMGFVLARHFPDVIFEGFEYVGERVVEGRAQLQAIHAELAKLHHVDLTSKSFHLPKAEHYFIYDFGTDAAIEGVLAKLRSAASVRRLNVIARGRRTQYAIDDHHSWLQRSESSEMKQYSVYKSVSEISQHARF